MVSCASAGSASQNSAAIAMESPIVLIDFKSFLPASAELF
jgi:hypothetical protein